jgi:hypothetical protein
MKKIIFLLAMLPFLSFGQGGGQIYFWYTKSDSLSQGENSYVAIKYDNSYSFDSRGFTYASVDTLQVRIFCSSNCDPSGALVYKLSLADLDTITKHSDGTTWIPFTVPLNYNIGNSKISITWCSTFPPVFVRSKTPDVYIASWTSGNTPYGLNDTTGESFSLAIDYTFEPSTTDTLKILIGDSIVYKGLYKKSLIFNIPYFVASNSFNLTIIGSADYLALNITKPNHVSGIFDPISTRNQEVHYYNIQGEEIYKPSEGFYIWKTQYGSGKKIID